MRRIRVTLEYDGAGFAGWQVQPDIRSVQGEVEAALERVTGSRTRLIGAGRTDAGVHARGQVAHFDTETRLDEAELLRALNAVLPDDVGLVDLRRVAPDFHARFDAMSKRYCYRLLTGGRPSPLRRGRVWQVRCGLDLEAMGCACEALEGTHDFAGFRGAPGGAPARETTRRTLDRLRMERSGDELVLTAEGRSFLRYMVRNIVGTLVEVGQGRLALQAIPEVLTSGDRSRAGPTAPPHGLCLEAVEYASSGSDS